MNSLVYNVSLSVVPLILAQLSHNQYFSIKSPKNLKISLPKDQDKLTSSTHKMMSHHQDQHNHNLVQSIKKINLSSKINQNIYEYYVKYKSSQQQ